MTGMTGMDLDRAVDELYGLALEHFLPRRTALAGAAKAAGDKQAATAITGLRKPTMSAWVINRLVRERPDAADRLAELAHQLRDAQQALDGARMKELVPVRNRLIDELLGAAVEVAAAAGVRISATVSREVGATFVAALAAAAATDAVVSGRLTRALEYAGFGEVDLHEATARPLRAVPDLPTTARGRPGPVESRRTAQPPLVQVARTAEPDDTEPDDTEPEDTEPEDTEPEDTEPEDTEPEDTEPDDAEVDGDDDRPHHEHADDEPVDDEQDGAELTAAQAEAARAAAYVAEIGEQRGVLAARLELAETRVATLTRDLDRARVHRDDTEAQLARADVELLAAERAARRARAAVSALTAP